MRKCSTCGPWWQLPMTLALVLVALLILRGGDMRDSPPTSVDETADAPAFEPSGKFISVEVNPGGGEVLRHERIDWHQGMTVFDAMRATPGGALEFKMQGRGASALLTSLAGRENEGASGHNWSYSVNDRLADRSFAVYELQPGDHVLWHFAPRR